MNQGLFRQGGKAVLLNSFNVETIFASIQKYRANIMAGVPTMYVFMLLFPEPEKVRPELDEILDMRVGAAVPRNLQTVQRGLRVRDHRRLGPDRGRGEQLG